MGRRGQSSPAFVYPPATDAKAPRGTPRSDAGVGTAHRPTRPHAHRPRTLRLHAVPYVRMRVWAPSTGPPATDAKAPRGTPRSEVGVGTAHRPTRPHDHRPRALRLHAAPLVRKWVWAPPTCPPAHTTVGLFWGFRKIATDLGRPRFRKAATDLGRRAAGRLQICNGFRQTLSQSCNGFGQTPARGERPKSAVFAKTRRVCNGFGQTFSQSCNGFGQTRRFLLQQIWADPVFAMPQRIWADVPRAVDRVKQTFGLSLQRIWADRGVRQPFAREKPRFFARPRHAPPKKGRPADRAGPSTV